MSKDEIIKELEKLKTDANDYSNYALMNEGYRTAIIDAMDLVKKLTIPVVSQQRELLTDFINNVSTYDFECEYTDTIVNNYLDKVNCG